MKLERCTALTYEKPGAFLPWSRWLWTVSAVVLSILALVLTFGSLLLVQHGC